MIEVSKGGRGDEGGEDEGGESEGRRMEINGRILPAYLYVAGDPNRASPKCIGSSVLSLLLSSTLGLPSGMYFH